MTAPRQVLPGTTLLVARRCSDRRFLVRPSERSGAIFRYVLAVAAERCGNLVHAFLAKPVYAHANPVAAGLVGTSGSGRESPGQAGEVA